MRRVLPARWLAELRTQAATQVDLPSEEAGESRHRIRVAAAIGTGGYLLFLAVELFGVIPASRLEHALDVAHDLIGVTICLLLLAATLVRAIGDRAVLALALGTELLLASLISIAVPWAAWVRTQHLPALTWVVPIVILFPLLVPARPRVMAVVSIACALAMPGGIGVLAALGHVTARASDYWAASSAAAVGVAIALVASRTVYGARQQVALARRMGGYELLEPLGRGGMGEVWRARHLLLARPAAVKLILPEQLQASSEARDTAVQRFKRKAQVTAGLRSPHTVQLFDFGVGSDGVMYYAMELLDGINLEHFVYRYGAVEPRRAVHWLRQACHSLGEAHACDLTHRDIKPANLFVCTYGRERDFLKVLDFGLARPNPAATDAKLTREGAWLGTPGYMAPEQVFGRDGGPSADLYALGCVAYWLLAGAQPFEGEDAGEVLRQHVQVAPTPLSGRSPHAIPGALEAVVMACLAKDPADRPRDVDELSERLARCLESEPWSTADAKAWWDGRPEGA